MESPSSYIVRKLAYIMHVYIGSILYYQQQWMMTVTKALLQKYVNIVYRLLQVIGQTQCTHILSMCLCKAQCTLCSMNPQTEGAPPHLLRDGCANVRTGTAQLPGLLQVVAELHGAGRSGKVELKAEPHGLIARYFPWHLGSFRSKRSSDRAGDRGTRVVTGDPAPEKAILFPRRRSDRDGEEGLKTLFEENPVSSRLPSLLDAREKNITEKNKHTHTHTFVDPWSVPNNRKNTQKILFTSWTRDSRVPSPKIEASKMAKLPNPLWSIRIAWRAANPAHLAVERGG